MGSYEITTTWCVGTSGLQTFGFQTERSDRLQDCKTIENINFIAKALSMKKHGSTLILLLVLAGIIAAVSCINDKTVTFRALLRELSMKESIARFPEPAYRLVQFSSYDRRSIHPDSAGWYANNDYTEFIREESNNGRREFVMFEAEGPGALVRWWMTFGNANALNSRVRIYIDGNLTPVIEGMATDIVGGNELAPEPLSVAVSVLSEPQRQGYNLYLPIPFSKACKVTLENDSVIITPERHTPSIYYSVSARIYDKGTRVVSFRKEMLTGDSLAIAECASAMMTEPDIKTGENMRSDASGTYAPGSACAFVMKEPGMAVSRFTVRLRGTEIINALKQTSIVMSFDGKGTVNVPAGSFFGAGSSINPYVTMFTSVKDDSTMNAFWLMPFRDSCSISVINNTSDSLDITASVEMIPFRWDDRTMYFGASWHEYIGLETAGAESTGGTGKHIDMTMAELTGRGIYAGDAVTVYNTADAWWGEGDEKIFVDGESFPSSFGTGTEDYYGYAWCRPEYFSQPLIAQPAGFGNFHPGMTVNMRYRILDAIPFRSSIKADIELWHWVKTTIDYGVISYYYLCPPA